MGDAPRRERKDLRLVVRNLAMSCLSRSWLGCSGSPDE